MSHPGKLLLSHCIDLFTKEEFLDGDEMPVMLSYYIYFLSMKIIYFLFYLHLQYSFIRFDYVQ